DDELCAIFGIAPREFDGRVATLAARIEPADLPGFRSAARAAVTEGHVLAHFLHIRDGGGGLRDVELWGRVPENPDDPQAVSHLVRRPPDQWLVFSLHPGVQGMTGWAAPVRQPVPAGAGPGAPVSEEGPPVSLSPPPAAPRVGSLYRVLQLGSALTAAVTAN